MKDKKIYNLLITQHEIVNNHIHQQFSSNDKFVSFGLTFLGAGFFVAYKENISVMVHLMTIIFGAVVLYGLYHYIFTFSNVGYMKRLEEEINNMVGKEILIRTKMWDKILINNFPLIAIYIVIGMIYSFLIYLSLDLVIKEGNTSYLLFIIGIYLILLFSIFVAFFMIFSTYKKAYNIADESFKNNL